MDSKHKIEDEIKFKDLFKSPIRLFGSVFIYFFILLLALGIFFGHKLITISFNEQEVSAPDSTNVVKEIPFKKGGVSPAVDLATIKTPSPEMLAKGKELYDANCKSCHGDKGLGDGTAGVALNPKPRNFTDKENWTNGRTFDQLYKTLQEGIISRGMAAYEYIPPADRIAIIHHIRTFSDFPEITDEQINAMNSAYNLSAGMTVPNTIPVKTALVNIVMESNPINNRIIAARQRVFQMPDDPGAKLLFQNSYDLSKVVSSFISVPEIDYEKFRVMLANAPLSQGFKPSILRLTKEELNQVFAVLKKVTS